jgi:hypothetical protein
VIDIEESPDALIHKPPGRTRTSISTGPAWHSTGSRSEMRQMAYPADRGSAVGRLADRRG